MVQIIHILLHFLLMLTEHFINLQSPSPSLPQIFFCNFLIRFSTHDFMSSPLFDRTPVFCPELSPLSLLPTVFPTQHHKFNPLKLVSFSSPRSVSLPNSANDIFSKLRTHPTSLTLNPVDSSSVMSSIFYLIILM